jgi:excisionase family DNA binding protein
MLKKQDLAEKLNISVPMVDKLMREGMPKIKIGKSVRFDYDEVLKWIKERG